MGGAVVSLAFMILGWAATIERTLRPLLELGLWVYPIIALLAAGVIVAARALLHGRIHIRQFSAGPAAVTLDEKLVSYFDQYLDEIVYFFETSKRDIVIFEDLRRPSSVPPPSEPADPLADEKEFLRARAGKPR